MVKHQQGKWKGVARKLVGCMAVASLAATLGAGAAFATDQTSTTYALPTADQAVSFQHTATDNGHEYTYEYVTIGSNVTARVAPMAQTYYETLGLNYINAYRGPDSIFKGTDSALHEKSADNINDTYTVGSIGSLQTRNSTLAIMGTSNNVAPDEYIWNYCCWANGANLATDQMALDHGNGSTGAVSVTIGGTEYADFPRSVYMECNILSGAEADQYGGVGYLAWIDLENQRADRPKSGTYNPYFANYSVASGGGATMVKGLHTLATTIDEVVAQSKDANGNYTLQSRYGGNSATGTGAAIDKYEDLVQATQYYVLSKLDSTKSKKAVTATLVGYDPQTGNYACRKYAVEGQLDKDGKVRIDCDQNVYGGRVAGYLASISTSITDLGLPAAQEVTVEAEQPYLVWYTPQQIVENCDAAFICDAYSANSVSTYLATASDGKCHTVYTPQEVGREEEDNRAGLTQAKSASTAAKTCEFCFAYPCNMFGNFYAQGVENGMLALITSSFTYPQYFGSNGLTDLLGYWAKYVWHIKDSALQTIVEGTCSYMDMTGLSIQKISSDFEKNAEKIFFEGNKYYLANMNTIDAINSGNLKTYDATALKARVEAQSSEGTAPAPAPAKVAKKANTMTVKAKTVKAKAKKKTTVKASKVFVVKKAQGKVTYKKASGDKKITISKTGKVTVKKGLKKGKTYKVKVKVTAAGNASYEPLTKTITLKIKVK